MTLEELQNKKVTITVNKTFSLGDDLGYGFLRERFESTELCGKEFLDYLIENYYSSWSDFEDILEGQDFKVTIHD